MRGEPRAFLTVLTGADEDEKPMKMGGEIGLYSFKKGLATKISAFATINNVFMTMNSVRQ